MRFCSRSGVAGEPKHALARGHFFGHTRLGTDDRAVADADMIHDPRLAGNDDVIAGAAGAGDAHLTDKEIVPADLAVVGHHDEVVDFRPVADPGGLECATVNRRARANFHVGPDFHMPELRNFDVPSALQTVTETIGSEHGVGVDNDTVAKHGSIIEDRAGIECHLVADAAETADDHAAVNTAACSQCAAFANARKRVDATIVTDTSRGMNAGEPVDAVYRRIGSAMQMTDDGDKRGQRIRHAQNTQTIGRQLFRSDHSGSPAALELVNVFLIFDEGDAAGLGFAERAGSADDELAVAVQLSLHQFRQLPEGGTHQRISFRP